MWSRIIVTIGFLTAAVGLFVPFRAGWVAKEDLWLSGIGYAPFLLVLVVAGIVLLWGWVQTPGKLWSGLAMVVAVALVTVVVTVPEKSVVISENNYNMMITSLSQRETSHPGWGIAVVTAGAAFYLAAALVTLLASRLRPVAVEGC